MKKLLLALACATALSACNDSGDATSSDAVANDEAILQSLKNQGLSIHSPMEVPGGLKAYAASMGTQALAVYIMPDANYALVGTLIDAKGTSVADAELQRLVSAPMDQQSWASLEKSAWVQDGDANAQRVVYVFTDANCPFCHELWRSARPWVEAGKVQLRHVMVGVIREDSPAKAAAILESADPQAALTQNEMNHAAGGIEPAASISAETSAKLTANVELMRRLGFGGTPGLVAQNSDGKLTYKSGVPRGMT
ncbi:thiol:disulfide interchange protein DsbG [Neoaquamicrobium sediminum]|uniref:thiol:disulfide interchange protein DsbG n=1 Tax=Neoaquamicrobium sediminum TaxID=1849104 RepID=UPI00156651E4|nr:thiol:disulfide interchange protein DsbG [Mesorhizobium sediminum]NRC57358.1 thiol:disulfide interchange protein DsbG [Mesorhizobium sediminum]